MTASPSTGLAAPVAPRLERLSAGARDRAVDAIVLFGAELVGWSVGYERYLGGPYALIISSEGERTLVVPAYQADAAAEAQVADQVVSFADTTLGLNLDLMTPLLERVRELVGRWRVGAAGDGAAELAPDEDLSELVRQVRLCKDAQELAAISQAFGWALSGQRAIAEAARPGVPEIELFGIAHAEAQRRAQRPLGFVCDLVSGPRTGAAFGPVNVAGPRELANGDVVVADVAVGSAFWGDSARTVPVGELDSELAAGRREIQAILDGVAERLVPGTPCSEVYEWVRGEIAARLSGWSFPHHAGHGVGASVFEDPHLIPSDHTPLASGMVLAVEPGAYLPGRFGCRIEDMFVVTATGGLRLAT